MLIVSKHIPIANGWEESCPLKLNGKKQPEEMINELILGANHTPIVIRQILKGALEM